MLTEPVLYLQIVIATHTHIFFCTRTDSFHEQLTEDSSFLKAEQRLDTELVDKLILQLNRIYPQILTDKEATKVSESCSVSWIRRFSSDIYSSSFIKALNGKAGQKLMSDQSV